MDNKIFTPNHINQLLKNLNSGNNLFIAYSGGVDSHVLLHILTNIRNNINNKLELTAIHINHNLNTKAKKWEKHCKNICKQLKVPIILENVHANIKLLNNSPEEIARKLRYKKFSEVLPKNASLLTAHHADDQAETILIQLFRGSGPKGLSAMPQSTNFSKGKIIRPLLNFSRNTILHYAKQQKLKWIEDDSNLNTKFSRNYIRHEILPQIKKQWPGILKTLSRTAINCAETEELVNILAKEDYEQIKGEIPNTLDITKIKKLNPKRQRNLVRYWITKNNFKLPSRAKIKQILRTIINSRIDSTPIVKWQNTEVRRYQNLMYVIKPIEKFDPHWKKQWDMKKPLILPSNLGKLEVKFLADHSMDIDYSNISVQFRTGGEKCKLENRKGTHKLKKLLQEWEVPTWQRNRIPLIYYNDEIIAVVGYCICKGWEDKIKVNILSTF